MLHIEGLGAVSEGDIARLMETMHRVTPDMERRMLGGELVGHPETVVHEIEDCHLFHPQVCWSVHHGN